MGAPELVEETRRQPFEPFRLIMTDDKGFDIYHPDLIWVGKYAAFIGLAGEANLSLFERTIKIDLLHVVRLEPLAAKTAATTNGKA